MGLKATGEALFNVQEGDGFLAGEVSVIQGSKAGARDGAIVRLPAFEGPVRVGCAVDDYGLLGGSTPAAAIVGQGEERNGRAEAGGILAV